MSCLFRYLHLCCRNFVLADPSAVLVHFGKTRFLFHVLLFLRGIPSALRGPVSLIFELLSSRNFFKQLDIVYKLDGEDP